MEPGCDKLCLQKIFSKHQTNGDRLNTFALRLGKEQGCMLSLLLLNVLQVLAKARREKHRHTYWEGRSEIIPSHRQRADHIENLKKLEEELISWFSKVTEYKVNM